MLTRFPTSPAVMGRGRSVSIINAIGLALLSSVPALRYQFFTEHELLTRSVFYCSNQDRTSAFRG